MKVFSKQQTELFFKNFAKDAQEPTQKLLEGNNKTLLKVLKWLKHYDEYYVVVNLKENKLDKHFGISSHLDYTEAEIEELGTLFMRSLIHPYVREWHNLFTTTALQILNNRETTWKDEKSLRYIINIPVRKRNGTYVFVKQMLFPFQRDKYGQLVSYMNVFTIVDEYRGQPLRPRFFEGLKRLEKLELENKKIASEILEIDPIDNFTKTEFMFIDDFLFINQKITSSKVIKDNVKNWNADLQEHYGTTKNSTSTSRSHKANIYKKIERLFLAPYKDDSNPIKSDTYHQCMLSLSTFESAVIFLQKSGILTALKFCFERHSKNNSAQDNPLKVHNF